MYTVRSTRKLFGTVATASIAVVPFALGSAILIAPRPARSEVTSYSSSSRTYKVGILLIDSTADANLDGTISPAEAVRGAENPDPFVFYIADQRLDLKPAGWTLENPLAPSTVTTDIFSRWSGPGGRDTTHPYQVGQKVTKDMAAYWEVSLTKATLEELLSFDVLFITNHRQTNFTQPDSEKLRKVVDAGGVVWLDDCGGMRIGPANRFFLEQLQFQGNNAGLNATNGPAILQPAHPLLNAPYALSFDDIRTLGDKNYGNYFMASFKPNATGLNDVNITAPNKETLSTIIGNRSATDTATGQPMPFISAGIYGSGAVIISSADIGCGVNDYSGGSNSGSGGNSGAYAGKNLQAANAEDLKFTYNAIAWGGANNTVRRNNRRVASSSSAVSAPLNPAFDFSGVPAADPALALVKSSSSPLISQGIMYVSGVDSAGKATVRAYDTVPNRDYDNDGNNDDGRPDLISGTPYDEIWRYDGPAAGAVQPSSPVLANVTITGISRQVILVTLGDGTVVMLDAKPIDAGTRRLSPTAFPYGNNPPTATGGAVYTSAANGVAPSPLFFGNKVYAVEPTDAVVRCINVGNFGGYEWKSTNATGIGYQPTGSPTLGLNRLTVNKTSGNGGSDNTLAGSTDESTNDIMMYVPVIEPGGTDSPSKLLPFWIGTRGEGNKTANFDGTNYTVSFRPSGLEANNVFVSKGKTGDPNSPFVTPSDNVKLYADVTLTVAGVPQTYTWEENFAAGRAVYPRIDPFFTAIDGSYSGPLWTVSFQDAPTNTAYYNGKINVAYSGDPAKSRPDRILAVVDYDVVYVPSSGTGPTNLDTQPGHRNVAALTIPNATSLDTAAFSPDDLLMYSANQSGTGVAFAGIFALQEREYSRGSSKLRWHYLLHNGYTNAKVGTDTVTDLPTLRNRLTFAPGDPFGTASISNAPPFYEALTNVRTVGSPITTNDGVTYSLAQASSGVNGAVTVLMAFQTAPQITLNIGVPLADGSTVTMLQYDPITDSTITVTGDNNDRTRLDVDYATGKVTVADFHKPDDPKQLFSASSTFILKYTPKGTPVADGGQPTKAFAPFGTVPNVSIDANGQLLDGGDGSNSTSGGFSPLLWYYVLPGTPNGSPVKIGDQIFLTIGGKIVAVDADPVSNDPTVRVRSGEQVYNVVNSISYGANTRSVDRNHVRWTADLPTTASAGAPSGDEGVVAVNTNAGTVAYSEGLTLLSDNSRVMLVNADGAAVWATNATEDRKTIGGEQPIYAPDGTLVNAGAPQGVQASKAQGFSSPQSVRRLGSSDYLVADTGNNRVVRFDRGAVLRWSLQRISDPYKILAPGDPVTLDTPTDVLTRRLATFNAANARIGYEDHYIIADSGNSRVLDVVDYYDLNGRPRAPIAGAPSSGVVVWTTRTKSQSGQNLAYNKLQLLGSNIGGISGKPVLVASVNNTGVAASNNEKSSDSGNGSLVQLDYNPYNTGFVLVDATTGAFSSIGRYWSATIPEPTNNGKPLLAVNELRVFTGGVVSGSKTLNAPSYFEEIPLDLNNDGTPEKVYLIADSEGVYLAVISTTAATPTQSAKSYFDVIWRFGQDEYNIINRDGTVPPVSAVAIAPRMTTSATTKLPRLSAASLKRLSNGNFLITNSAAESSALFASGRFAGEVFEVKPKAFDLTGSGVNNTVTGGSFAGFSAPKIIKTAGALNKQQMGRDTNGATLTEQPRSADRL